MSLVPQQLVQALQNIQGFNEKSFLDVHAEGKAPVSIRLNPLKPFTETLAPAPLTERVPWCENGFYLHERPAFIFDPLLHGGAYYVQEASSMFLSHALTACGATEPGLKVLDLCAAPGGKSTLIQSKLAENSLLVSNEVIKSRASILEENLTKWGGVNTVVSNNDPRDFQKLSGFFDGIVVDAPCSGSGLFRKDPAAINEWSEQNVALCSQRQQRILADVWPALKEGGFLIYSTCSYSMEENEHITDWILKELGGESIPLDVPAEWGIMTVQSPLKNGYGYRFFPDRTKGEGFYLCCISKTSGSARPSGMYTGRKIPAVPAQVLEQAAALLNKDFRFSLIPVGQQYAVLPAGMEEDIALLQSALYLKKAGVLAGMPSRKEWIPEHALALSPILKKEVLQWELPLQEALAYLRKEDIRATAPFIGWGIVKYGGVPLGWIKALSNRVNNYYPAAWRILKKADGRY